MKNVYFNLDFVQKCAKFTIFKTFLCQKNPFLYLQNLPLQLLLLNKRGIATSWKVIAAASLLDIYDEPKSNAKIVQKALIQGQFPPIVCVYCAVMCVAKS